MYPIMLDHFIIKGCKKSFFILSLEDFKSYSIRTPREIT